MINLSRVGTAMPEQDPKVRVNNNDEVAMGYTEEMAVREALRCLKCREHPCMTSGCPIHNNIPAFIEKITEGAFEEAYQILTETTALPAVCGRVCPQYLQCEGKCVRGDKGRPVAIGALERFVADWHRHNTVEEAAASSESENKQKKVAVIGSGPAGIACAGKLADKGYAVTIFEKEKKAGGVLSYGIPEFRLPREIVDTELEKLQKTGVVIDTEKELGRDISIDSIMEQGFDAVFIGNGAGKSIRLGIPGQELKGVLPASGFLYDTNIGKEYPKAEKIAVIGGGNVAMDACRAAARVPGVQKVYVVYRRSMAEMPSDPKELREAVAEGVEFIYLTGPVEVVGDGYKAVGLKCQKMELTEPDASGRRKPVPIPGSEFVLEVDCIIEAIGSESDNDSFGDLEKSSRGYITTDPDTFATSRPGVFAGGDTVTGPKTVIAAMGAGIKAAESIAEYLEK
ncbi:MAG: NAD(P)-dependent oxidoreductase [Eubacterium sp.]|nr:NAD(P)-dependent oxidoreductase [Eubacterium sp.]